MIKINGTLSGKKLLLEKINPNQGEAGNVELQIMLEPYNDTKYYLEFLCPYGRIYLSTEIAVNEGELSYIIPACVFLVAGKVYVQLIGRNSEGVIIKSNKSADASIEIMPSVNGVENLGARQDFISNAENILASVGEAASLAEQKAQLAEQTAQEAQDLINTIRQKLENNELSGKDAYSYATDGGYSGDINEFYVALAKVGQILEDAPNEKKYIRQKGSWVETAEMPMPDTQKVGQVLAVTEGENGAKYELMPLIEKDTVLDADSLALEAFARDKITVFKGGEINSSDENIKVLSADSR